MLSIIVVQDMNNMNNASPFTINQKGLKTKWISKTAYRAVYSFISLKANFTKGCWYLQWMLQTHDRSCLLLRITDHD